MITIQEAPDHGLIRAIRGNRQIGYALPLHDPLGRYLVRLPNSCAAPFDSRYEALAALRGLETSPT